ncbi:hypothetical protein [Bdellovibrio bacteriovorus]|uniref:hypothetical protein n=1 Tax=Bdellovibrio bacteriovorus TaxID=959 RepID=UPI0035A705C1
MRLQTTLALVSLQLGIASCGLKNGLEANSVSAQSSGTALKMSKVDVNANPLDKTVCDPFGGIPADNLQQGIKASLYYLAPGMPLLNKSEDYVTFAKKSDQKLFFADLNVPTRMFHEGFATQTHDVLKDDAGTMLIENFGVKFETILKLSATDEEGDYELALLSDDGSKLKILSGTLESPLKTTVIDNDGEHPTRMGCASQILSMNRDKTVPLELTYYQGPRYHISNVLLWRKASVAGKDEACGQTGNEHFFDPNKGSVPQQAYNDLLARGWKVVQKENFFIPKNESYNPCVEGTNPLITKFKVAEIITQGVQLSWSTDIAATSQVKLINKETQEVILTNSDNVLRTSHFVQVTGLKSQTTYTAQAVSISEDLGKSLSEVIEFTTP